MDTLEQLTREARTLANGTPISPAEAELGRVLQICNGCRYCEGFCASFQAMTRRLEFGRADLHYLANLCHNCGACLHACQYAPPHEFAINVPRAMAQVRWQTYGDFAWPAPLGALYRHNGVALSLSLALGLALFLWLAARTDAPVGADFYAIFPHNLLVSLFMPVFGFAVLALGLGVRDFWRAVTPATTGAPVNAPAGAEAAHDVLRLKYLDGGHGEGCNNADDAFSLRRRRAHHLTFYGFLLCFAATSVATLYHYVLGIPAPYDWPSLPKVLGAIGGVMLCVGTLGLWALKWQRHPLHGDPSQRSMDYGFIVLLLLVSASGLALWALRGQSGMALTLCVHLGSVMALFATLPYNKFAHGIYRSAALLRHAVEKRQPNTLGLGGE